MGNSPTKNAKTIIIEISGGVLVDVRNLPEGWEYELINHDHLKDEGKA